MIVSQSLLDSLWTSQFWGACRYIIECLSGWIRLFSHGYVGVTGVWEENHKGEVPFTYHLGDEWSPRDITGDVNLCPLVKVLCVRFLHWKITIFSFPYAVFLKYWDVQPLLKGNGDLAPPAGGENMYIIRNFFYKEDLFSTFIHSVIYLYPYGLSTLILLFRLFWLWPSGALWHCLTCPFDMPHSFLSISLLLWEALS